MSVAKIVAKWMLACTAIAWASQYAKAEVTFQFSFTGAHESGSGTLYAVDHGNGSFTATAGSGTEVFQGTTYGLNLEPGVATSAYCSQFSDFASQLSLYCFDNTLLSTNLTSIDPGGLLFLDTAGYELNLMGFPGATFGQPGTYLFSRGSNRQNYFNDPMTFSLTQVPEPTSIALFALGGAALMLKSRRKNRVC